MNSFSLNMRYPVYLVFFIKFLYANKSAPYGTIIGYASSNVPSYSNGNDTYISYEENYLYGIYMGIKWQCVEYARRWLFLRKGCAFSSIPGAADMWTNLDYVQQVVDGKQLKLNKYPNGCDLRPQNESLLIYSRSDKGMPYGHVAVIVDVLSNSIRVAEENYYPYYWSANYSREIPFVYRNGSYFIEDIDHILGWMTIDHDNRTQPLDQITINTILSFNQTNHFIV